MTKIPDAPALNGNNAKGTELVACADRGGANPDQNIDLLNISIAGGKKFVVDVDQGTNAGIHQFDTLEDAMDFLVAEPEAETWVTGANLPIQASVVEYSDEVEANQDLSDLLQPGDYVRLLQAGIETTTSFWKNLDAYTRSVSPAISTKFNIDKTAGRTGDVNWRIYRPHRYKLIFPYKSTEHMSATSLVYDLPIGMDLTIQGNGVLLDIPQQFWIQTADRNVVTIDNLVLAGAAFELVRPAPGNSTDAAVVSLTNIVVNNNLPRSLVFAPGCRTILGNLMCDNVFLRSIDSMYADIYDCYFSFRIADSVTTPIELVTMHDTAKGSFRLKDCTFHVGSDAINSTISAGYLGTSLDLPVVEQNKSHTYFDNINVYSDAYRNAGDIDTGIIALSVHGAVNIWLRNVTMEGRIDLNNEACTIYHIGLRQSNGQAVNFDNAANATIVNLAV